MKRCTIVMAGILLLLSSELCCMLKLRFYSANSKLASLESSDDNLEKAIKQTYYSDVKKYLDTVTEAHLALAQQMMIQRKKESERFFNPARVKHLAVGTLSVIAGLLQLNSPTLAMAKNDELSWTDKGQLASSVSLEAYGIYNYISALTNESADTEFMVSKLIRNEVRAKLTNKSRTPNVSDNESNPLIA